MILQPSLPQPVTRGSGDPTWTRSTSPVVRSSLDGSSLRSEIVNVELRVETEQMSELSFELFTLSQVYFNYTSLLPSQILEEVKLISLKTSLGITL